jgi:hypothetical protein
LHLNPSDTRLTLCSTNAILPLIRSHTKKNNTKTNLINKILTYSAKKIKAKPPALYSILNPETSSDSSSAKSKGFRLVSAKQEINHTKDKGKVKKINRK